MKLSLPLAKRIALACAAAMLAALLFLWQALPGIVQSRAEKFVTEKTGHRLSMARPEFSPFALRLRLADLKLVTPQGAPLLSFDELVVDLAAASLSQRALVFDDITLKAPLLTVEETSEGLNWAPFIGALKSPDTTKQEDGLPRLDVRRFALSGGQVAFADRRHAPGFTTQVTPLDIALTDISTLPDDSGKFSLQARTSIGASLVLAGEVDLDPMTVSGTLALKGLEFEQLATYVSGLLPGVPKGSAELTARYRIASNGRQLEMQVEAVEAGITALQLPLSGDGAVASIAALTLKGGRYDLASQQASVADIAIEDVRLALPHIDSPLTLGKISLSDARIRLTERQAELARLAVAGGGLVATRTADGKLPLLDALQGLAAFNRKPAKEAPPADAAAKPWAFRLEAFELNGLAIALRDESIGPAAELRLENIDIQISGLSHDMARPVPARLGVQVATGGKLEVEGRITPGTVAADLQLKLADLSLKPAEPYLASRANVQLADGRLSTEGRFTLDARGPAYRGNLNLRDLRILEAGTTHVLLGWKRLNTNELSATPKRLDIGELRLGGLDTQLIIDKDKQINFKKVMKPTPIADPAPTGESGFSLSIDRLRFYNGAMFFADESLVFPFGTRIHGMRGSLSHLSSRPGGAYGQLELEGEVDEYGMARAVGEVDLFDPTGFMDIRVLFRNVEMPRLTPYLATFAGRRIDSGKLSLDLQYQLKQRQLKGENQIVVERLKLGERVESASAKDLPLDLAIAVLEDSDGRIDLGLPISGSLDDPEFSYGSIVWKAITNVLTKIVTAPFRAIGALFGGGSEKVESVTFEAGMRQLTPPEREKLVKLAQALEKRPGLQLTVGGTYAESDRVALQDVELRRTLLRQTGERVSEERDPGSLSTALPKVRTALEELYAQRIGTAGLVALKEGFRQANPGQMEESMTGRMMSRLSGLLREKKTLSQDEVDGLKGADFHAVLYERLRAKEPVSEERLQALGQSRAEHALATLKNAGVDAGRIHLRSAEKQDAGESGVSLRLALEAAKKD